MVEKIVAESQVKTAKLFRAAVMMVINDSELLDEAIRQSKTVSYRKTGANAGQWKRYIRNQELKRGKEKAKG